MQTFFKDYLTNICKLSSRIECHLLAVAHVPSPCCGISLHFGAELFSLWRRNDLAALKREGISALNIHKAFCTASFVKSSHAVGLKVFIWTVDDARRVLKAYQHERRRNHHKCPCSSIGRSSND